MDSADLTRFMGIDYGLKRVGIALSDPLHTFAYSLTTLINDESLVSKLKEIIRDKNIQKIILGMPSDEHKSVSSIIDQIRKFKELLSKEFKLEIIEWDETFTSVIAQNRIIESVSKKKKRKDKGLVDMNSASIILQEYLNSLK